MMREHMLCHVCIQLSSTTCLCSLKLSTTTYLCSLKLSPTTCLCSLKLSPATCLCSLKLSPATCLCSLKLSPATCPAVIPDKKIIRYTMEHGRGPSKLQHKYHHCHHADSKQTANNTVMRFSKLLESTIIQHHHEYLRSWRN